MNRRNFITKTIQGIVAITVGIRTLQNMTIPKQDVTDPKLKETIKAIPISVEDNIMRGDIPVVRDDSSCYSFWKHHVVETNKTIQCVGYILEPCDEEIMQM